MIYSWALSLGTLPIVVSLVAAVGYVALLKYGTGNANHAIGMMFSSMSLAAFASASLVASFAPPAPQTVFATQLIACALFLALGKLSFLRTERKFFHNSDMPRQKLVLTGACSALLAAAVIFFPVDIHRHCETFRCRGFDAMFGGDPVFSYYYIVGITGVLTGFLLLAATVNLVRGSHTSTSWDQQKKSKQ